MQVGMQGGVQVATRTGGGSLATHAPVPGPKACERDVSSLVSTVHATAMMPDRSAATPLLGTVGLVLGLSVVTDAAAYEPCAGLPTHTDRMVVKPVARPPFMQRYRDPAFGSTVMRITDAPDGGVLKPAYSTVQAWNADESRLMLYRAGDASAHVLLDGHTYEPVAELDDVIPADVEEMFWSHSDPDILFYVSKHFADYGQLRRYDITERESTLVAEFDDICGERGLPTAGGDPHMPSLDDDLFGFRCRDDAGVWHMISYRVSTDETFSAPLGEGTDWEEWSAPQPGPSGTRFWMQGTSLSTDLTTVEARMDMARDHEHANLGLSSRGEDVLYQVTFDQAPGDCVDGDLWRGVGHLTEHTLSNGRCRPVVNADGGYPYTTSGTHVSAQATEQPGWVAMSSVGYDQFEWFTNGRRAPVLFSEIYLVNTDPAERTVCRLAQHRSYAKQAKSANYAPYFGEPHATISPSGTRIVFGSDWYDSGSVDSYVIELPGYVAP